MTLTIFPEGGLASSVITTVWVGVFVLCFFNLRFGWVLSGLVVPGYLVPLLIVKPMAAVVIGVEAVLTYLIVWVFSEKISRGRFPSLFGRDRFMGLILASIAVRLSLDGYLLPMLADWLSDNWDRSLDWRSDLQSFGLVIISLLANQFWKPGLARGLVAAVVTTGLTLVIVRYGLMEFTNFRISGVSYLYEGLASSILASPKAYIILVVTALIASQMNVRYGWDFSGILIPALIALQWYQPTKILTSFLEAAVIYFIARLLLKLPVLANATIEGGRKLLLFFNVSFAWKMALGWAVVWLGLDIKTTDVYGFGYLLSTLIAIKAHDKNIFPRLARSTLEVSLAGAVLGNLIGFALATVSPFVATRLFAVETDRKVKNDDRIDRLVMAAIGDAHVRQAESSVQPLGREAETTLAGLVELLEAGELSQLAPSANASGGWQVVSEKRGRLAIARADGNGRDLFIFDPDATRDLAVTVPAPATSPGLALAAMELRHQLDARWLVISSEPQVGAIGGRSALEIFRRASRLPELAVTLTGDLSQGPELVLAGKSARAIDVALLRRRIPGLSASFSAGAPIGGAQQRDIAMLAIDVSAIGRINAGSLSEYVPPPGAGESCRIANSGLEGQALRRLHDRAYLRFEVIEPLLEATDRGERPIAAMSAARIAGFAIEPCLIGEAPHWRLTSRVADEGSYFIAQQGDLSKLVHGYADEPRLAAAAIATHRAWNSGALLISPTRDNYRSHQRNTFGIVNQALLRMPGARDGEIIQWRVSPPYPLPGHENAQVVVAEIPQTASDEALDAEVALADRAGYRAVANDRSAAFAGFEAVSNRSLRYLNELRDRSFTVFWLRPRDGEAVQ